MISCQSLGPMVTGEIWPVGSLLHGWPHRGCQAGVFSTANMFLSSGSVLEWCSLSQALTNKVCFFHIDLLPNLSYLSRKEVKTLLQSRKALAYFETSLHGTGAVQGYQKHIRGIPLTDTSSTSQKCSVTQGGAKVILGNVFLGDGSQGHTDTSYILDVWDLNLEFFSAHNETYAWSFIQISV